MKVTSVRQEIATGPIKSTGAGKLITCAEKAIFSRLWGDLVCLVALFCLVYLVYLVGLVQPNKQDKPNNGLLLLDLYGGREATLSPSVEELKTF